MCSLKARPTQFPSLGGGRRRPLYYSILGPATDGGRRDETQSHGGRWPSHWAAVNINTLHSGQHFVTLHFGQHLVTLNFGQRFVTLCLVKTLSP